MSVLERVLFRCWSELGRVGDAVRRHPKRILMGALAGWITAVWVGAVVLAGLETLGWLSRATSDELGIVIVLYGVGIGALNGYALRPATASDPASSSSGPP